MSRIGNRKINIPEGVTVTINDNLVIVKGPKGELTNSFNKDMKIDVNENILTITRPNDLKTTKSLHGTTNALIENMIIGVSEGYKKELEIVGVGYRFNVQGNKINVNAGFRHPVEVIVPNDLKAEQVSTTEIAISGIDKQKVSEFAAGNDAGKVYTERY